ncbi:amidase family protein [Paenibacillus guangzhouensis]|uniref:amidase family protein n=1 Tax=Paenibacillus guangzhouensis TaxID=1473112 RepID=UPI001266C830|nr:amidase family protein [Paenibacillus guangzhouensis]
MTATFDWLIEADIEQMQAAMASGELSAVELVQFYLDRIEQYDKKLDTILEINPDALAIAEALDAERQRNGSRGPLHGIPILVKDNIDTHDRMHTSAGSIALANSYAAEDSFVAAKLRSAGAILLGKANMTEWANFMSSTMWSGYSSRGGLVLNPYGPGEIFVGGSSSGSGASIAANLAAAAIGTETSGSIISPASQNGIVGIKPTVGLVSRSGIIPIAISQDSAGPMTRTVRDTAILLGALTGVDPRDPATASSEGHAYTDYTQFLDADYLPHARIGVPRCYIRDLDQDRRNLIEAAIEVLRDKGATIVDPVTLPCEHAAWGSNIMRYEFKKGLNDYLARLDDTVPVRTLADVIQYNEAHASLALKYGQDVLTWAEETRGDLTEPEYRESLARNKALAADQGIDYVLQEHQLDALVLLGCEDGVDLAAMAGYPVITVPGGYAENGVTAPGGYNTKGPQGITFIGTAYSEPTLLKIAYSYEQATRHRVQPSLDEYVMKS